MFNRRYFENSQPDGIGVLEIAPQKPAEGGEKPQPRQFVPLKRTDLRGEIAGPLADLRLVQTFGYTRDQCALTLEAVYRFPLPGDAAVTSVRVRFGDVEIEADLKERQQAEAEYEEAKKQGQQAALTTRESVDVFTLQVAGLQPDQEVVVETHYVQLAKAEGAGWALRIPLTTSPRYVRGDELGSREAKGQPLFLLRDPGHRFALDLRVSGAENLRSPTHALTTTQDGKSLRVQLREGEVLPDRDCLLLWQPPQEERRPTLLLLAHDDVAGDYFYFLALATPPAAPDDASLVARESIVLVDHSGSMSGAKWDAADWAVSRYLFSLRPTDAIALGLFHNTTRWFADQPQKATEKTVADLQTFVQTHKDSGGTELGVALEQALAQPRTADTPARHVFIITDAEVSDAARILRLADAEAEQKERRRISVLCIDAAPNAFLANELAERGGGMARFLTSQPEEGDISTALDEIMADWAAPVYAGLRLAVNRGQMETGGGQAVVTIEAGRRAADVGDLPAGRPRWIVGRIPRANRAPLTFRLIDGAGNELAAQTISLAGDDVQRPALKALFGARRVIGLEYLIGAGYDEEQLRDQLQRLGYDPALLAAKAVKSSVYAENQRQATADALKGLLVSESLSFGLACSETAFIAVRKEKGQPIAGTVPVANALPAGWSEDFLAARGSAGPALGTGLGTGLGMSMMNMSSFALPVSTAPTSPAAAPKRPPVHLAKMAHDVDANAPALDAFLPAEMEKQRQAKPLFSGKPRFQQGQAVLFDSADSKGKMPNAITLSQLELRFPKGAPAIQDVDPNLILLIYVDDLVAPRARIRLADLIRQGGKRPLNVRRPADRPVRVVLEDPAGAWARKPPKLEIYLSWQ